MATKNRICGEALQSTFAYYAAFRPAAPAQFYCAEQADTTSHFHSAR